MPEKQSAETREYEVGGKFSTVRAFIHDLDEQLGMFEDRRASLTKNGKDGLELTIEENHGGNGNGGMAISPQGRLIRNGHGHLVLITEDGNMPIHRRAIQLFRGKRVRFKPSANFDGFSVLPVTNRDAGS